MSKPLRIAMGGIRHETNTFSPFPTAYHHFQLRHGATLVSEAEASLDLAEDISFQPTFVANALPGGLVRRAAYERLKQELLNELHSTLPVDGVYLDLHGAMEVETIGDGEGDLCAAVRALVGEQVLISVSLDLHGNISPRLIEQVDILTALRTAPHRDGSQTRGRALDHLLTSLKTNRKPEAVMIKLPLLLSGEQAVTDIEPARSLYARLAQIEQQPGILDASLMIGCAWTDSLFTSASVIVVADQDRQLAYVQAAQLADEVWARRHEFGYSVEVATVDEAIRQAMAASERPVFISDSGDNVTAGAPGDQALFLEHLLALGVQEALVAGLTDPVAVRQCIGAGIGAQVELTLGNQLTQARLDPLRVTAQVEQLSVDSETPGAEPNTVLIRIGGIRVILTTARRAFTERRQIAAAGIDPMTQPIVVVKLGYLFPDLADHAPRAIMALSPGATDLRLTELPYRQLPQPIFPLVPDLTWTAGVRPSDF